MKNVLLLATLMLFAFFAQAQNNGMEQRARAKAEAAAQACLRNANYPSGLEIHSSAQVSTICDYVHPSPQYFGYTVTVWGTPNCPPNMACIQIVYPIATVQVSCNGDVSEVTCEVSPL